MIDIGKIIKRAWYILWNYRVLWIFGVLLAFTAGGANSGNSGSSFQFNGNDIRNGGNNPNFNDPRFREFYHWLNEHVVPLLMHPERYVPTLIWIGVGIMLFILVMSVIVALIRYPSESAVIRMADEYEQSGTKMTFKQGWKLGWTRRAFRMWVIDLVIGLPGLLFIALVLGLGILFFASAMNGNQNLAAGGMIAAIGCTFLFLFFFIILMVFLGLLRQFFVRAAVLEDAPIGESFRRGWVIFKRNWKSAALMWLVMVGIGIGFGIASMIVFFLLIPVYIILLLPGAIVAAIPGLIALGIASLFTGSPWTWVIAALVALPFLLTVAFLPLYFLNGWYQIFNTNIWTLTYREIKALDAGLPAEPAAPLQ